MPEEKTEHRKLAAIMFTDIVGYSAMMQKDDTLTIELLEEHRILLRSIFPKHRGTEKDTAGDAFLVEFDSALNATSCAIEIQEAINKRNLTVPQERQLQLRIGIHLGDVVFREDKIFGDGVNIAARIEPLAEPGGICITREVYDLVKRKLNVEVISLGQKELRNIKDKIDIYEILVGAIAGKEFGTAGYQPRKQTKPIYKRTSSLIIAGIILIALVLVVYFVKFKKPETQNQMVSRILKVPGYNVRDPNISPDGNWVVYIVADVKNIYDLYVQNISSGEPRKITNDTGYNFKQMPCFSPDASEILFYQQSWLQDSSGKFIAEEDIYKVSTLGGTARKIINNGDLPMWSPDGKNVAFLRINYETKSQTVWIANTDGSSPKQVAEQTGQSIRFYNLAWSPNSKSLAYLRNFTTEMKEPYTEIFIHELETGKEEQLTFGKKLIDDFCWTTTNEIIFNQSIDKNVNLWTIPASGGNPSQLTFEPGINRVPRISKDAKRLVYLSESDYSNLWVANLETKDLKQISFEEVSHFFPIFSPLGDKILMFRSMNSLGNEWQLFICNADGSEPVQITHLTRGSVGGLPQWSSDGTAIAYTVSKRDTIPEKPDSTYIAFNIFIHKLGKDTGQIIGKGTLADWSSDNKYLLFARDRNVFNPNKYVLALTSSPAEPIKEIDSRNTPSFTNDSKNVVYSDSVYIWSISIENGQQSKLFKLPKEGVVEILGEMFDGKSIGIMTYNSDRGTYKVAKLFNNGTGLETLLEIPGGLSSVISYSPSMNTILFTRIETRNKIILIDNFR